MTILGSGWLTPAIEDDTQRQADVTDLRYEQLLATVDALRTALLQMPTPVVNVSEPDLSAVVNAVNSLRPGATADEIGEAIVSRLGGGEGSQIEPVLAKLTTALETLDFRMKGMGAGNSIAGPLLPPALSSAPASDTGQAALPVRIISQLGAGTGGSVGLTNTELRATPVPVSGTVSTGLSQPLTDTQLRATAVPISLASAPTTPVTGTFWPVTQPVSLATNTPDVTDRAARLLGHVTVDSAPTTAVTGTFWQATQPVSGPVTDAQLRASAVPVSGTVTANAGTGTMAVSGPVTDTQLRASAVPVTGSGTAGTPAVGVQTVQGITNGTPQNVMQAAITKGTQGTNGVTTQDMKDAGRAVKMMFSAFVSTALAETAINFQVSTAGGAPSVAAASYTMTAGKTLRIQTIVAQMRAGGSAPAASLATFKIKVGGNQQGQAFMVACPTTVAAGPSAFVGMLSGLNFPDGWELAAGAVLSFTLTLSAWTAAVNTPTVDLTVIGYEY